MRPSFENKAYMGSMHAQRASQPEHRAIDSGCSPYNNVFLPPSMEWKSWGGVSPPNSSIVSFLYIYFSWGIKVGISHLIIVELIHFIVLGWCRLIGLIPLSTFLGVNLLLWHKAPLCIKQSKGLKGICRHSSDSYLPIKVAIWPMVLPISPTPFF